MGEAFLWGFVGSSSLIAGGVIALTMSISRRVLGLIMAFGAGVLISAVAFELVEEAAETTDRGWAVATGLFAGALTFYLGDLLIDRMGGSDRKSMSQKPPSGGSGPARASSAAKARGAASGAGLAITLGIILDGVPESAVLGLNVVQGAVSAAMLTAVFLSNLPEAIGATTGLRQSGWTPRRLMTLWVVVSLVSGLAAMLGYVIFQDASPGAVAFLLAFAGGAILTMLADTMMPEAFEYGGPQAGLLTTLGFALAFGISSLE
jgi:ZIP family zinc transporter